MAVDQIAKVMRNIAEIDELGSSEAYVFLTFKIDSPTKPLRNTHDLLKDRNDRMFCCKINNRSRVVLR